MGIYVNPGNTAFEMSRYSNIYVDKTMLISITNNLYRSEQRFLCVSRPRRFGKSMAANMLSSYYSRGCDSSALFSGLKIDNDVSFKTHLNQHHVIRLDIQRFLESEQDLDTFIYDIEQAVVEELMLYFPDCKSIQSTSRLKAALDHIFSRTGKGFIFIIDEWDCVFRFVKERSDVQKRYLDFLRGLFKGSDYVDFAYLTGILPVKKYGEHSALNIFDEYSMVDPKNLNEYFGFTDQEVRYLCQKHGMDYSAIQTWYDGYLLGRCHIYNPKSVVDALTWKNIKSYWTGTESYEALKIYIDMNFDGLKESVTAMLGNSACKINPLKFQNDMTTFTAKDDVLTLLVHLGYLTYNEAAGEVSIPNQEISQEFLNTVDGPGWDGLTQALNRSEELLERTWALDGDSVANSISAIHNETASILKYHDENSLACTILMAYYSAKALYMNPIMELPTGKGFADVVYLPKRDVNRPALIVELKWDKSAKGAIRQIKEKKYASWIQGYTGHILLIGISYNKKGKWHQCIIEDYLKED